MSTPKFILTQLALFLLLVTLQAGTMYQIPFLPALKVEVKEPQRFVWGTPKQTYTADLTWGKYSFRQRFSVELSDEEHQKALQKRNESFSFYWNCLPSVPIDCGINYTSTSDANDGQIKIELSDITPPYEIEWTSGSDTSFEELEPGVYELKVVESSSTPVSFQWKLEVDSTNCSGGKNTNQIY